MQSRTSFFDSRIYRNALSRFWLMGLGCAMLWAFTIFSGVDMNNIYVNEAAGVQLLRTGVRSGSLLCMGTGVAVAAAVYGWMFFTGSTAFTTALPIRREAVFVSDMAAGFTLLEGGTIAAAAVVGILGGLNGAVAADIFRFLGVVTLLNIFYFGFTSVCACLTGNILILPAVYAVLLYAAVALEASLRALAHFLIFGLTGSVWKLTALSPSYHLHLYAENLIQTDWQTWAQNGGFNSIQRVTLVSFTGWPLLAGYAAAGLVFAVLAVVLVRRRTMESAGAAVAIPFLRRLFPWCAALAGALTMGLMALKMVFNTTGYLPRTGSFHQVCALLGFMLLGVFIGWFGAQGLLRRTARVFDRGWGGFALACAVTAVLVLGCEADILGVERAQVDLSKVGYVEIFDTYAAEAGDIKFSEPENLAAALALQKKIVTNKSVYESAKNAGYYGNGALSFLWFDREGNLLQSRMYVAPGGAVAWASCGDAYEVYVSGGDAYVSGGDVYVSGGSYVSEGDVYVSGGTYVSGGDVYVSDGSVPSGSRNPALQDLQDLMNTPEAIEQRLRPMIVPASAGTAYGGYYYRLSQFQTVESYELPSWEAWDVYNQCILPDAADGTVGQVQLCPAKRTVRGSAASMSLTFIQGYGDNASYDGISFHITPAAARTCAWLAERGLYVPGWEPAQSYTPAETEYTVPPEGLAALLENVKLNFDPDAAGTVVAMRWTRSLLEWYDKSGEDVFAVYEDAKTYAWMYSTDGDVLPRKLDRLRTAGLQLVSGSLGLVRDRSGGSRWSEDTVNDLFDAIRAGLAVGSA